MNPIKIEEALRRASSCLKDAGINDYRIEAQLLLAFCMQLGRLQLYLNRAEIIPHQTKRAYCDLVERRCSGEPFAYITGEKFFYGRRFLVNRNVLIPRPETELIIDSALEWSKHNKDLAKIDAIDLGTGSGILAITLALELPLVSVTAVDVSAAALATARINAVEHGVENKIGFYCGSYFDALEAIRPKPLYNLVISNPPYINSSEMESLPGHIREYEPVEALHGGKDGLDGYRAILKKLSDYIQRPGLLLFEVGADHKEKIENLCLQTGLFRSINWRRDLLGHQRLLEGEFN